MRISEVAVGAEFSLEEGGPVYRIYQRLGTNKHQPGKYFYAVTDSDGRHKTLGCSSDLEVIVKEHKIIIRL